MRVGAQGDDDDGHGKEQGQPCWATRACYVHFDR